MRQISSPNKSKGRKQTRDQLRDRNTMCTEVKRRPWSIDNSAKLYGINNWGAPYFSINKKGNIQITPLTGSKDSIDLLDVIESITKDKKARPPILIRFDDILSSRVNHLFQCFQTTIAEYGYKGCYRGVYPIKVNQQKHLVEEILRHRGSPHSIGLECGSKPELLIALAKLNSAEELIICNGFKDYEYVEMALLARQIQRNTIIVLDRFEELNYVIRAYKALNIRPVIGVRCKLVSKAPGRWEESSGGKSKFGLTPIEILQTIQILKQENLLDCFQLLHFHIGSQVSSIQSIKQAIKEGSRFFTEIFKLGVPLKYFDVGGGLGVDYNGHHTNGISINYTEQEYSNDVVSIIQSICDSSGVDHPDIISESGRSLVAHSSLLIFNVLGKNKLSRDTCYFSSAQTDSSLVKELSYMLKTLSAENINEYYNDLLEKKNDIYQLFNHGVLNLEQRAKADDLYFCIATKLHELAANDDEYEDMYWKLEYELAETYFCNFSVFQSLPDSWAISQLFPLMPIHRLDEEPVHRAVLADLTCDSDGKINMFVDSESSEPQNFLEVHKLRPNEDYYLGVFLTGAYQEILGDLHNLFGDTDAIHLSLREGSAHIEHLIEGDSIAEVLHYVQYSTQEMVGSVQAAIHESLKKNIITKEGASRLLSRYESELEGYTYLEP